MTVRRAELVADIGGNARLDATGTEGDQGEAQCQSRAGVVDREREMADSNQTIERLIGDPDVCRRTPSASIAPSNRTEISSAATK